MKSLIFTCFAFSLLALTALNCNSITNLVTDSVYMDYDYQKVPYKLYAPDQKYLLHYDLEEISGLSMLGDAHLAVVQDELGYVYVLKAENGELVRKIKFAKSGDYEGIEVVGNSIYVVKSNGDIYSFKVSGSETVAPDEVDTDFSSQNDVEGLSVLEDRLLVACKKKGEINDKKVKGKAVYSYNIKEKKVSAEPLFHFREEEIEDFIKGRKFFNKIHSFDPSAIAVHPLTSDIYWLSADKVLVVLSPAFHLKEVVRLDRGIYKQPEGICFAQDGTMYLSSEGDGARGKIFKISYKSN
ncbi:SdiA-regulated domain-containing protein [Fulvivirga sp. 29W222]|uniref:SdiA-regulated domain-containing protein n=1 Tax=Fulvivirga marina TaxID=2494733 RepID=A0A937KGT0_9BACT|nr:SdiA-regulated domain-containing protein [Fulvivirga marina]MBL6449765.1 SdiA-regulated domain-containing protein [Fulvivirga marina]